MRMTKEEKARRERERYRKKVEQIEKLGLTGYMSPRTAQKNWKKEVRKARTHKLQDDKIKALISAGYTDKEARKLKRKSWDFVNKEITYKQADSERTVVTNDKVYICKDVFLYTGFSDKAGNTNLNEMLPFYEGRKNIELKNIIRDSINSIGMSDDSGGRAGDVLVLEGSYSECYSTLKWGEATGYQGLLSNKWSLNGILKVTACLMDCSTEANRPRVLRSVKNYLRYNIPELYKGFIKDLEV